MSVVFKRDELVPHEVDGGVPDGLVAHLFRCEDALDVVGVGEHVIPARNVKPHIVIELNAQVFLGEHSEQLLGFRGKLVGQPTEVEENGEQAGGGRP